MADEEKKMTPHPLGSFLPFYKKWDVNAWSGFILALAAICGGATYLGGWGYSVLCAHIRNSDRAVVNQAALDKVQSDDLATINDRTSIHDALKDHGDKLIGLVNDMNTIKSDVDAMKKDVANVKNVMHWIFQDVEANRKGGDQSRADRSQDESFGPAMPSR